MLAGNINHMSFAYSLAHYFFPRQSNNQKARILHSGSILLIAFFLLSYQLLLQFFPTVGIKILGYAANISPAKVVELTNQKRGEAGLGNLVYNPLLEQAAKAKAQDMLNQNYWSHVAPDGTEPWKFFVDAGYRYRYAGENLARDFSNPESAVEAWMASPSHKDNLLSSKYTEVGIAVIEGDLSGEDTTIIVQLFGTRLVDTTALVPVAEIEAAVEVTPIPTVTPAVTLTPSPASFVAAQVSPVPTQPMGQLTASPVTKEPSPFHILISPFNTTKTMSLVTIIVLLAVMGVDAYFVAKRKITRVGGRIFAHLAFLGMVLVLVIIAKAGQIL